MTKFNTSPQRGLNGNFHKRKTLFLEIPIYYVPMIVGTLIGLLVAFHQYIVPTSSNSPASVKTNEHSNNEIERLKRFQLRYDWTKLEPLSILAKNISRHQRELCHLPLGYHEHRPTVGMGSNLHVWTQAVCAGMEKGLRIRTGIPWNSIDKELCNPNDLSSMTCYFPQSELQCSGDIPVQNKGSIAHNDIIKRIELDPNNPVPSMVNFTADRNKELGPWLRGLLTGCPGVLDQYGIIDFRAGAIEFLFSPVSQILQDEAERQLRILFGKHGKVPRNLVTVHIRWGDKFDEMKLISIENYVQSVKTLINGRLYSNPKNSMLTNVTYQHIYVASEDPKAITAFRDASPKNWIIYEDVYLQMYEANRTAMGSVYNNHLSIIDLFNGRPALVALASILVSMQANEYVLSTGSNWSRLINELRKTVVDLRCNKCTRMIDLGTPDEWR